MITGINRYNVLGSLASFWSTQTADAEYSKIISLVATSLHNQVNDKLLSLIQNMSGVEAGNVGNTQFKFKQNSVLVTESVPGEVPEKLYPAAEFDALSLPERYYILPYCELNIPKLIRTSKGKLALGIDFYYANEYLWFTENPLTLFEDYTIHIEESSNFNNSNYNYIYNTSNLYNNIDYVAKYLRYDQTPKALKLALAAICKLPIIRKGGVLRSIVEHPDHVTYVFEDETVNVYYEHTRLISGASYAADSLIDAPLVVLNNTPQNNDWYRRITWNKGLSLDAYSPFTGLTLEDKPASAFVSSFNTTYNKPHIIIDIASSEVIGEGNTKFNNNGAFQKYWEYIHSVEAETGYFLNDIIGLQASSSADIGVTKKVNPIDVYFEAILKQKGLIVLFDEYKTPFYQDGVDFLNSNKPFGYIPITFVSETSSLINEDSNCIIDNNLNLIEHE